MGTFSLWHWLILLAVVLVLFGGSGKISSLMGDVAKGIKSFKKGLAEDDSKTAEAKSIDQDVDRSAKVDANTKSEAQS
jgi:sec-independent protein translocase protein TatA